MQVNLKFQLPDALNAELQVAAETSRMTPSDWAAQLIEAELASRRLPHVEMGRLGAQIVNGR